MPRRNLERAYREVRKAQRDSRGLLKTIAVVDVVQGTAHAEAAVDRFERRLTEEEKKAGITRYWAYTSRSIGRGWRR